MSNYGFKFGEYVKDGITGFSGTIDSVVHWLSGSIQYSVSAASSGDGKMAESHWVDPHNLKPVEAPEGIGFPHKSIDPVFEFNMRDEVKSAFVDYKGTIIGKAHWSNGCNKFYVRSKNIGNDGQPVAVWFEGAELTLVKERKAVSKRKTSSFNGGPSSPSSFHQ